MIVQAPEEHSQRIGVEIERPRQLVKIRVEHYDETLGWYTSGSLSLPLRELPLLQQAIEEMQSGVGSSEPELAQIIPFPGLAESV